MNPARWGVLFSLALHLSVAGAVVAWSAQSTRPPEPYRLEFDFSFSASAGGQAVQSAVAAAPPQPARPKPKQQPPKPVPKPTPQKVASAPPPEPPAPEPSQPSVPEPDPPAETAQREPQEAPEPTESPVDDPGLRRNYVRAHSRQLVRAISAHFDYPELARQRGWTGKVLVAVLIGAQGEITGLEVVKSSGYALLDQSALSTLQSIQRLPPPPRPTRLILPITFRLNEG